MALSTPELLQFMRRHRLAVLGTIGPTGPQAAVVGIAVTDTLEIVFDSIETSRKIRNLRADPRVSFVIGGTTPPQERTVQYEGVADEPQGEERERLKETYYVVYPDGKLRLGWAGLVYIRVRPTWIRYSDFNVSPPVLQEFAGSGMLRGT